MARNSQQSAREALPPPPPPFPLTGRLRIAPSAVRAITMLLRDVVRRGPPSVPAVESQTASLASVMQAIWDRQRGVK